MKEWDVCGAAMTDRKPDAPRKQCLRDQHGQSITDVVLTPEQAAELRAERDAAKLQADARIGLIERLEEQVKILSQRPTKEQAEAREQAAVAAALERAVEHWPIWGQSPNGEMWLSKCSCGEILINKNDWQQHIRSLASADALSKVKAQAKRCA